MSEHIAISTEDQIMKIQFNRPEKKNALTQAMYTEVKEALEAADADNSIRVVYISGAGENFTSGNDIKDFAQTVSTGGISTAVAFLQILNQVNTPLVAVVEGAAVGIGTTMLLHCDLAYAGSQTRFQMPFVNLGLVPEAGSSFLLPHLIGPARAMELLLFGEPFDATTALDLGIVNAVLPEADLHAHAWQKTKQLAQQPPHAVKHTKRLVKRALRPAITDAMNAENQVFAELLQSPEAQAAFQAFLTKKKG